MDLFLHPDERSLAISCPSSSRSDGLETCPDRISTGLILASLSLPYTHLYIFSESSCHVVCFSRKYFPRFWHSLHIPFHSMIFIVSSITFLSFCAFRILEYLLIGIFSWDIVHGKPTLSVCWVDLDIFMPYELLHCLYVSLAAVINTILFLELTGSEFSW
jgi:hypothetical protein